MKPHHSVRSARAIVRRLLSRNISPVQIAAYFVANLLGLAIIAVALQFHADTAPLISPDSDSFISRDYMILSKRVSGLGSILSPGAAAFSPADIDSLRAQKWTGRIGVFTPARFNVTARIDVPGSSISTALFLEGVPDDFIDNIPDGFDFTPGVTRSLPLIVGRDYLSLYNFGFASSRSLPQVSESMIASLPLQISVSGNGRQMWIPAHIAGFSSRLNTIAAPRPFVDWANGLFSADSTSAPAAPSRIIVEVTSPGNPDISAYLAANSLEAAADKGSSGKASYMLTVVTSIVAVTGIVITILSLIILMLGIHMLLLKNRPMMRSLMMLGYSCRQLAAPYWALVAILNTIVAAGAMAAAMAIRHMWLAQLSPLGMRASSPMAAIVVTAAVALIITLINAAAIMIFIRRSFPAPFNQN